MIELQQLIQLLTIAKYGTLSGATNELHISQPSLSRSMKALESELGVTLFDRTKNKITLNEAGNLALTYARHVIDDVTAMENVMQAYERSQHTLTIGTIAPGPLWSLTPLLMKQYPEMNISTEINVKDNLKEKLINNVYQLIVTMMPFDDDEILSIPYCEEQLFVTVPPAHPFAIHKKGVHLSDLAGETMLLYTEIGLWEERVINKLTKTTFIRQTERFAFQELVRASALPSFTTNLSIEDKTMHTDSTNRITVPLLDEVTKIQFYCSVTKKNQKYINTILQKSSNHNV